MGNNQNNSIRVSISQTMQRETPKTDFGSMFQKGGKTRIAGPATGREVAAPFVPGGSVLSAALSGISGIFEQIHDGVGDLEEEVKRRTSGTVSSSELAQLYQDLETLKRQLKIVANRCRTASR